MTKEKKREKQREEGKCKTEERKDKRNQCITVN